jgi:ribonucleoside-diphosphate reductase alpha chain
MVQILDKADLILSSLEINEPKFSTDVTQLLDERYFMTYPGESPEKESSWLEMSRRVARVITVGLHRSYLEANKGVTFEELTKMEDLFYRAIALQLFVPSSPILYNAGMGLSYEDTHGPVESIDDYIALWKKFTPAQQLASCFTGSDVGDSVDEITQTAAEISAITKGDGGYGINLSNLRPQGARVKSNNRQASGPVSFMPLFDTAASVIQFSRRRGALMGVLNYNHPDILKFIGAKDKGDKLNFFNISVGFTDSFTQVLEDLYEQGEANTMIELNHPETGSTYISFKEFIDTFVDQAYETGDPGILLLHNTNRYYVFPDVKVTSCNPCSEKAMPENMSCNLGSINLYSTFTNKQTEQHWDLFEELVAVGVVFLDSCINATSFPTRKIEENVKKFRPLGLGIMGAADLAVANRILYSEIPSSPFFWELMMQFSTMAYATSKELGQLFGFAQAYGKFDSRVSLPIDYIKGKISQLHYDSKSNSVWEYIAERLPILEGVNSGPRRNSEVLSIAPTGAISTLSNVSWSIEPHYSKTYIREAYSNDKPIEIETYVRSLQEFGDTLPCETALKISPYTHIAALEFFQMFIDSGVSKTINMKKDVTKQEVHDVLITILNNPIIKGATIYRDGSKERQVVVTKDEHSNGSSGQLVLSIGKDNRLKPLKRKEFLPGMIHRSRLENGDAMFTIVTFDDQRPVETFILTSEGRYDSLAKILSKALRAGASWDVMVKTLNNTSEDFLSETLEATKTAWETYVQRISKDKPRCPSCGSELKDSGASLECSVCGYALCLTC